MTDVYYGNTKVVRMTICQLGEASVSIEPLLEDARNVSLSYIKLVD